MRLWSIHPRYLDRSGLLALWREALLAQKVLSGKTFGYRNHPQLYRFKNASRALALIGKYLAHVHKEGISRGYKFDRLRILRPSLAVGKRKIRVSSGQINFERGHLLSKLKKRSFSSYLSLRARKRLAPHPLFQVVKGDRESWEKTK